MEFLSAFLDQYGELLFEGTVDTLRMVGISTFFAYVLGIPLGVLLHLLGPSGPAGDAGPSRLRSIVFAVLGWIVNMGRSLPFIILLIFLIPFTRALVGTTLGVPGAIVPLVVSATPFVARMVEQSIAEVDTGLVEAAQSMGASTWQIVAKVYLREGLPSLLRGLSITVISLLGYTAIAGTVGAGGLGDIAIRYGHQRYQDDVMIATVIILVILVQLIQVVCEFLVTHLDHRMHA